MRWPRFRLRTLMIPVAVAALILALGDAALRDMTGAWFLASCYAVPIVGGFFGLWGLIFILSRRDPPPG